MLQPYDSIANGHFYIITCNAQLSYVKKVKCLFFKFYILEFEAA